VGAEGGPQQQLAEAMLREKKDFNINM